MLQLGNPTQRTPPHFSDSPHPEAFCDKSSRRKIPPGVESPLAPQGFRPMLFVACRTIASTRHSTGNTSTGYHNASTPLRVGSLRICRWRYRPRPVIPHRYTSRRLNRHRRIDPRSIRSEMAHPPVIAFPLLNPAKYAASGQAAHHP